MYVGICLHVYLHTRKEYQNPEHYSYRRLWDNVGA